MASETLAEKKAEEEPEAKAGKEEDGGEVEEKGDPEVEEKPEAGEEEAKEEEEKGEEEEQQEEAEDEKEKEDTKGKRSAKRTRKTPVTPSSDRPARERKVVERYSVPDSVRSSSSKTLSIGKGSGTPLKDIPNVAFKLSKRKADDELQMLHNILFGKKGKLNMVKRNIGQFSGFVWVENEEKQKSKVREKLDKCNKDRLLNFCDILNIPRNKAIMRKEELATKIVDFLESPHATTDVLLADKEQKGKKRKLSGGRSVSSSEGSATPAKKQKKITKKGEKQKQPVEDQEDEDVDEEKDEDEDGDEDKDKDDVESPDAKDGSEKEEDNGAAPKEESEAEEDNDATPKEESEAEEEEVEAKEHVSTPKASSRKKEKESSQKKKKPEPSKKTTPAKTVKSPPKSSKKSSVSSSKRPATDAEGPDSKKKGSAAKKQKVEKESTKDKGVSTKDKATRKVKLSEKSSGKDQGKAKSGKKAKAEPTREEMHAVVVDILKEVDFNTATLSDILRQLSKHFGVDLTHQKAEVKELITEVINNMSDEEDGEEAEDNSDEEDGEEAKDNADDDA